MKPLSGVTIVEAISPSCPMAVHVALAMCGRIASDAGARVVKMDHGGSPGRVQPIARGSALDRFLDGGKDRVSTMVPGGIVITDDEALASGATTRVIFTAFPRETTAPRAASEFTILAMGGLLDLIGDDERQPLRIGGHQLAYAAGLAGYTGLASALVGGAAATVDVNLLDVAVWLNWKTPVTTSIGKETPTRIGKRAEWQVVRCADGWMAVVYMPRDWPALKRLVGDHALDDERFDTMSGRRLHGEDVMRLIERAFSTRTRADIHADALRNKVPLGPVWSLDDLLVDPHNVERGLFVEIDVGGEQRAIPRLPVLWNGEPLLRSEGVAP